MKVALFFDGKNFYSGWRERASRQPLDFTSLSKWLVRRAGGNMLGAYYYTGIETSLPSAGHNALNNFLDNLEMLPGFFVHRFPRRIKSYHCRECNAENHFSQENEVDTTMVADMLRLSAVGAFDALVLMSGDADHAPALEGVRALGRQAYVATWGGVGLSKRIRRAAFDHIDLVDSLEECSKPFSLLETTEELEETGSIPMLSHPIDLPTEDSSEISPLLKRIETFPPITSSDPSDILVDEVRRAESKFPSGYVGVNFFVTRWSTKHLDPDPEYRRRLIDDLVKQERIDLYMTPEGTKAIRVKKDTSLNHLAPTET